MTDETKPPEPAPTTEAAGPSKTSAKPETTARTAKRPSNRRPPAARQAKMAYDEGYRSNKRVWPD